MGTDRIPLALLTGFLGSGKTTVMNDLLSRMKGERVAVVVNEWGKLGVDGSLLADPAGLGITELPGGQIFCSCLAPAFLKALERLSRMDCDRILVETSGLAKPALVAQLAAQAERASGGRLQYRGLVCVVDALRFLTLRKAVMAVDEQASYADRFVVSKADAVDEARLEEIGRTLAELRPGAPVDYRWGVPLETDLGIGAASSGSSPRPFDSRWSGWGAGGRPRSSTLVPTAPVPLAALESFLRNYAGLSFRIKGFVEVEVADVPGNQDTGNKTPRMHLVDCVEERISIQPHACRNAPLDVFGNTSNDAGGDDSDGAEGGTAGERLGLTFIWKKEAPGQAVLERAWSEAAGRPAG